MALDNMNWILGQLAGLVALTLCVIAFASKRDDRLFLLLLVANVAFTAQFALLESWVAAGITAVVVLRVWLVRRYRGNRLVMSGVLAATVAVAALTWAGPADIPALMAGILGTCGMFLLQGVAMRGVLAAAAFCWIISNVLAGSFGGTLAEALIFVTNLVTIVRLRRDALNPETSRS